MSERLRNVITVSLIVAMGTALVVLVITSPSETDRVRAIGGRIKCPVCQGESIADSPSTMARDMMDLIADRVAEGRGDTEIVDELLTSFSGAVLLDPPASGATLFLWIAPLLAVGLGVGVVVWWRGHPPDPDLPDDASRPRRLAPLLILAVAFGAIVVTVGFFLQDREGPASGLANVDTENLGDVSNETLEAVVAANSDDPEIDGMRLALAERYYSESNYQAAFPHYLAVAESPSAKEPQVVTALIRLGWIVWAGNAEVETAVDLFDEALEIDAGSTTARYLKGQVLWCGADEFDTAADLFEQILADPDLPADSRALVQADLTAVESGAECT